MRIKENFPSIAMPFEKERSMMVFPTCKSLLTANGKTFPLCTDSNKDKVLTENQQLVEEITNTKFYVNSDDESDWKTKGMNGENEVFRDYRKNLEESHIPGDLTLEKVNNMQDILNQHLKWKCKNLYDNPSNNQLNYLSTHYTEVNEGSLMQNETNEDKDVRNSVLHNVRDYLANYQESYGTPQTEYSFASLVRVMGHATARSLFTLFYIVINIFPILEIFLHIVRFALDKTINIQNTRDFQQIMIKYFMLAIQLLCVYICLTFIFGFIVLPIIKIASNVVAKILMYD